ncbi:hypothetical protein K32_23870 [Kaistia sp. 32K]|uniref:hypothetical protein n=1 Tax=Kaistia sp. 32K TaxID=2795690 RepID=UPI001914DCFF|nr:hypothetical protein [Kaistia sp. 32K]BCP53770.1 hypothetical protein K32_23870 [Kaistia sp. 32K]
MKYQPPYGAPTDDAGYVNGNPAAGVKGSIIPAEAVENPQREIVAAIRGAGLTPDPGDLTQLLRAVRSGLLMFYPDTGTANHLAIAPSPAYTALVAGNEFRVLVANTVTGAATLSVSGLGNVAITHRDGSALASGDLAQGQIAVLLYDGSNFQLQAASTGSTSFTIPYAADNGSANTIVANYTPAITSLTAGLLLQIKVAAANTGGVTINVNGLGAKSLKNGDGTALSVGALAAGEVIIVTYDGTNFQLGSVLSGGSTSLPYVADSSGTANLVVANFSPAVSSYAAGQVLLVKIANTNTAAATLNANSLGAVTIVREDGTPLQPGDLVAGKVAQFIYNGSTFQAIGSVTVATSIGGSGRRRRMAVTGDKTFTITADALTVEDASGNVRRLANVNVTGNLATTGAGGMDSGSPATGWLYGYAIFNPVSGDVKALASASASAPTLPAGYTMAAYIGALRYDSSGALWRTSQAGKYTKVLWGTLPTAPPTLASGAAGNVGQGIAPTWSAIAVGNFVPPTAIVIHLNAMKGDGTDMIIAPNNRHGGWQDAFAALATAAPYMMIYDNDQTDQDVLPIDLFLESTNIYYAAVLHESGGARICLSGWSEDS